MSQIETPTFNYLKEAEDVVIKAEARAEAYEKLAELMACESHLAQCTALRIDKHKEFINSRRMCLSHNMLLNVLCDVMAGGEGKGVIGLDSDPAQSEAALEANQVARRELKKELLAEINALSEKVGSIGHLQQAAEVCREEANKLRPMLELLRKHGMSDQDLLLFPNQEALTLQDIGKERRARAEMVQKAEEQAEKNEKALRDSEGQIAAKQKHRNDILLLKNNKERGRPECLQEELTRVDVLTKATEDLSDVLCRREGDVITASITITNSITLTNERCTLTLIMVPNHNAVREIKLEPHQLLDQDILNAIVNNICAEPQSIVAHVVEWLKMQAHVREEVASLMEWYDGIFWDQQLLLLTAHPKSGVQCVMQLHPTPMWPYGIGLYESTGVSEEILQELQESWKINPSLDSAVRLLNLPMKAV